MTPAVRAAALGGLLLSLTARAAPVSAQTAPPGGAILNLSASGEVRATPNEATVTLGVQTNAATAAQALADNAARMSRVIAALRQAGVAEKYVQTSGVNLAAQYDYQPNQPPRLTGYQASNDVTVTVEDLTRLGPALDAVVAVGANQINGISFGLKDAQDVQDVARRAAVKALQAKAALYAQATGYPAARLVKLSEGGEAAPSPIRPVMMAARAKVAGPTPIEAGELVVRIEVTGTYELTR